MNGCKYNGNHKLRTHHANIVNQALKNETAVQGFFKKSAAHRQM